MFNIVMQKKLKRWNINNVTFQTIVHSCIYFLDCTWGKSSQLWEGSQRGSDEMMQAGEPVSEHLSMALNKPCLQDDWHS